MVENNNNTLHVADRVAYVWTTTNCTAGHVGQNWKNALISRVFMHASTCMPVRITTWPIWLLKNGARTRHDENTKKAQQVLCYVSIFFILSSCLLLFLSRIESNEPNSSAYYSLTSNPLFRLHGKCWSTFCNLLPLGLLQLKVDPRDSWCECRLKCMLLSRRRFVSYLLCFATYNNEAVWRCLSAKPQRWRSHPATSFILCGILAELDIGCLTYLRSALLLSSMNSASLRSLPCFQGMYTVIYKWNANMKI